MAHLLQTLLLGNTHGLSTATGGLGVLTTDSQAPRVTETTVDAHLLHALKVLAHLVVQVVGEEVRILAVLDVLLTIEEPVGNLVFARVLHDGDYALQVGLVNLTGTTGPHQSLPYAEGEGVPLGNVNLSLAADKVGVATATTGNGRQGIDDLLATINVGVEDTENVLKASLLRDVQRL